MSLQRRRESVIVIMMHTVEGGVAGVCLGVMGAAGTGMAGVGPDGSKHLHHSYVSMS